MMTDNSNTYKEASAGSLRAVESFLLDGVLALVWTETNT